MPLQEDYRVSLEAFQGPLDLLLFLIRRAEVDVNDIPVAVITDQYLAFLKQVDDVDVDLAGEFLVMAATLIELKSRTLAPPEEGEEGEAGAGEGGAMEPTDPRYELVQQLLAYQRFRIAADDLDRHRLEFSHRFPLKSARRDRSAELDDEVEPVEIELDDVHVMDLADTYEHIMASIDLTRIGDHVVEMDDTPLALHQEDLLDRLTHAEARRLTLQDTFEGRSRSECIGLFLATLELVRQRRITVLQDDIYSDVELVLVDEEEGLYEEGGLREEGTEAEGKN